MSRFSRLLRIALHRTWWNRYARSDPFWAVLTETDKKQGGWNEEAFFHTGAATIDAELLRLQTCGIALRFDRSLDFGCGLGRLTNGLAGHFAHTTGVDISPAMLKRAARLVRHPGKIDFVATADPQLGLLPADRFDLVYSEITLQHIAPADAEVYITNLVRIARPGGAISFQLPSKLPPPHPVERFKFSFWPPTFWMRSQRLRLRVWERSRRYWQPHMPMYAIPQSRVVALLQQAGARLVEIVPSPAAGPTIESFHYRALKGRAGPASAP